MDKASPDLQQAIRSALQRSGLHAFWRWWMTELAPLVPERVRNALRRRRLRPIVAFGPDTAVVWTPRVADGRLAYGEAARVSLTGDAAATLAAGREAIEALPPSSSGVGGGEPRVVVGLPDSQVLRKVLTLPAAVEESLVQMLGYDLDRHTPFKPEEVYFDAVVVGRNPARKEIRVDWAAAQRAIVDALRRQAESWGAVVAGVTPESPQSAAALGGKTLNLLPPAERSDTPPWRRWEFWVPIGLLVALAIAAAALPIWQKRGYAIALMQLADQGRVQADASNTLREQLERLSDDYNFALQRKYSFPAAVQVVEDVSKMLPDDTWLTQLEVKTTARGKDPKREVVLRGESANAGRLVSLLEDSKLVEQAAPRSPTMKIQPGPGEIFDLGAQLKPLPLPSTIQLAAVEEAASAPAPKGAAPVPARPASDVPGAAAAAQRPAPAAAASAPRPAAPQPPAAPIPTTAPPPAPASPSAAPPGSATGPGLAPPVQQRPRPRSDVPAALLPPQPVQDQADESSSESN